jgi:hypothetical protein
MLDMIESRDAQIVAQTEPVPTPPEKKVSRREFLRGAGLFLGLGGSALACSLLESRLPFLRNSLENQTGIPRVNLMFFYEYHQESPEKWRRFKEMFDRADVFVTEAGPWDQKLLDWFRQKPEKIEETDDIARSSEKPLFFIDPPESDPLWKELPSIWDNCGFDYSLPYKEAVERVKEYLVKEVDFHKRRERVWEQQLMGIMTRLNYEHWFTGRSRINIMIDAGAYHTQIYHQLAKRARKEGKLLQVERTFSENPFIFYYRNEAMRRLLFKNQMPTNEAAARVGLEDLLDIYGDYLKKGFQETPHQPHQWVQFLRRVTNSFSQDEIQAVFERIKPVWTQTDLTEEEKKRETASVLTEILQEKGITVSLR